jgi:hypothetical protein
VVSEQSWLCDVQTPLMQVSPVQSEFALHGLFVEESIVLGASVPPEPSGAVDVSASWVASEATIAGASSIATTEPS